MAKQKASNLKPKIKPVQKELNGKDSSLKLHTINLNDKQKELYDLIDENRIIFITGPAGTGKTFSPCWYAMKHLSKNFDKFIISKPIVESGSSIGFLPGTVDDKIAPYAQSFWDNLEIMVNTDDLESLKNDKKIDFRPINYMRGSSLHNKFIFIDECQNLDFRELMLVVTRLGKESKLVIAGDIEQHDIKLDLVQLPSFISMLKGIKGIAHFQFEAKDIVREEILIEICERYSEWKIKNPDSLKMKK